MKISHFNRYSSFFSSILAKVHGIINGTNHTSNGNGNSMPPTMVPPNTLHQSALNDVMKSPGTENEQTDPDNGMLNLFV